MKTKLFNFLTAITLFLTPVVNFAQAPDLGSAASFALFTGAGAFTNDGTTFVTGDIGTNVGAFSGFPPGIVIGEIHVADGVSAQAATDVDVAYSYLSNLACGLVIGTTLGNGQVLTPNIYCLGAASSLNGDLVLDGGGDPNALFIFKIDGALSTTTLSNVILINSASACNVYWQINGAVELGVTSVFRGTIVANGAISLLQGATLFGRGLTRAGAIALHTNRVDIVSGCGSAVCNLDVSYTSKATTCYDSNDGSIDVTVTGANGNVNYLWSDGATTEDRNNLYAGYYTVVATDSAGCKDTTTIHVHHHAKLQNDSSVITPLSAIGACDATATLKGKGGRPPYVITWSDGYIGSYRANLCPGIYNLSVRDKAGCEAAFAFKVQGYSSANKIAAPATANTNTSSLNASVSPNPAKDIVNLSVNSTITGNAAIVLYNIMSGKQVMNTTVNLSKGMNVKQLDLSSVPKGVYEMQINAEKNKEVLKVVVE